MIAQYMAPELLQGATTYDNKVDKNWCVMKLAALMWNFQVDVWSLGMLLYEMIARKIPYQGMSPGAQVIPALVSSFR